MIQIKNKVDCCGCNACGDVCPTQAISFKTDIEGFWYPEVDMDKCIDCHACERVCPIINIDKLKHNDFHHPECYAGINKNIEVRFDSTSGGAYSAFATAVLKQGGYVGGAVFNDVFLVHQIVTNDKNDLAALRSSKYLQSDCQQFYKDVKKLVVKGEKVMVCGTPCQMAALRSFLHQKDYENLIIIDFICRGINSPKVWRKYLDYLEGIAGGKVVYAKPKNKELGWRNLTTKFVFDNKKVIYQTARESYFTKGYLSTNVYCRPSCYDCKFKGFPRMADISVADYWGAENNVGKDLDDNMGTSLIMINSEKGKKFFESCKDKFKSQKVTFESILPGNPALVRPLDSPKVERDKFYESLDKHDFKYVIDNYLKDKGKPSKKTVIKNYLHFLLDVKRISHYNIGNILKNLKYNLFCKNIHTDISRRHYMLIERHCVLDIHPQSEVNVNGIFHLGYKKFARSKLETRLLVEKNAKLDIDEGITTIYYGADIEVFQGAKLFFGGDCGPNINCTIICGKEIRIERDCKIGRNVTIRDNNGGHYIAERGYKLSKPVILARHSWLCEGCTILSGAKVGEGAVIGAHAVVSSHVPHNSLAVGNPAQVLDDDVNWKY